MTSNSTSVLGNQIEFGITPEQMATFPDGELKLGSDGKLYLTGGVGSRHDGETIGNPYELPADTGYCESCAAIASIFWNWRMLLVTGDARYADLLERTLYNGFLSSPGLDGLGYFYVNPLLVHKHVEQLVGSDAAVRRQAKEAGAQQAAAKKLRPRLHAHPAA